MSYNFSNDELQRHLNQSFVNTIIALWKEKHLTLKQKDEILANYSVIIETKHWLPKALCKWLGLDGGKVMYRLVKAINRKESESNVDAD